MICAIVPVLMYIVLLVNKAIVMLFQLSLLLIVSITIILCTGTGSSQDYYQLYTIVCFIIVCFIIVGIISGFELLFQDLSYGCSILLLL